MQSRKLNHQSKRNKERRRRWKKLLMVSSGLLLIAIVSVVAWHFDWPANVISKQAAHHSTKGLSSTTDDSTQSIATLSPAVYPQIPTFAPHLDLPASSQQFKYRQKATLEASYYDDKQAAVEAMATNWTLLPHTVGPGDVLLVRHNQPGSFTWQEKTYKLLPFGTGYYAYVAVSILTKPGTYKIGNQSFIVKKRAYKVDRLTVSNQLESIRENTKRIMADQRRIDKARSHSASTFLFKHDSDFIQPVHGRISTPFGNMRYVNGKYDGSHRAIDIAAPKGTPVKATNDGVVVLADKLYLTGNSVYIDHGMNLFSQYIHMSKLLVKKGDHVKKGQTIGLVGSTGFSTGPHLHFTFWANNIPVNPNEFFGTTPFQW